MAGTLTRSGRRWLSGSLWVAGGIAATAGLGHLLDSGLHAGAAWQGVVLLVVCLALTLFNVRKKLPFLPLLPVRVWTGLHLAGGVLAIGLFLLHSDWSLPGNLLNRLLSLLFLTVAGSGLVGWWLSRNLPGRLTRSGEPLTHEHIPRIRRTLAERIRHEALDGALQGTGSSLFADLYRISLHPYLQRPAPLILALKAGDPLHRRVERDLEARRRYMSEAEHATADRLVQLLDQWRNLNVQDSGQRLLRHWLFVHVPFTWGLWVFILAHVLIVLMYRSVW